MEIEPRDCTVVRGIPVTQPGRTILDLAEILPLPRLMAVVKDAVQRKIVRIPLLQRLVRERGTRGRHGACVLERLLAELGGDYVPPESKLEELFLELIARAGLPKPLGQVPLIDEWGRLVAEIDFAYRAEKIAIWLDGRAYHGDVIVWEKDLSQAQEAAKQGWRHVRFTWSNVTREGDEVVATLRSMLGRPADAGSG